jgi:hypothetical protein
MRERTYIAALISLDMMLILTGGAMAWLRAIPAIPGAGRHGSAAAGALSTGLIAIVGAWLLYELNVFAFRLAEVPATQRNSRLAALAFAGAAIVGGISALTQ